MQRFFFEHGRAGDFKPFFSIYVFYLLLQILVFGLLTVILYRNIRGVVGESLDWRKYFAFALLLTFFALPSLDLIFGLSDINNPGVAGNGLLYGDYFSAVYVYCITVPVFNLLIYCVIYARYLEGHFARRASTGSRDTAG